MYKLSKDETFTIAGGGIFPGVNFTKHGVSSNDEIVSITIAICILTSHFAEQSRLIQLGSRDLYDLALVVHSSRFAGK